MEITDIRIFLREEERLKAYAAVTFDSSFVVHNMRVIDGKNGLFVSMPSKRRKDGKYQDVAHPITTDMRQKLDKAIIESYKKASAEKKASVPPSPVPVSPSVGSIVSESSGQTLPPVQELDVSESAEAVPPPEPSRPLAEEQK